MFLTDLLWLQWMIRNTKRKPIRVYMSDGSNDLNNQHGSWPLANQQVAAALDCKHASHLPAFCVVFCLMAIPLLIDRLQSVTVTTDAGYDYHFDFGEGSHGSGVHLLPEMLRFAFGTQPKL